MYLVDKIENEQRRCFHPPSPLQGITRVTSLKVLGMASHWPTDCLSLRTWMTLSVRVRGPCTPSVYCGLMAWSRQLCNRCFVRSSFPSSLTPPRRGGDLRPPWIDSVSMLFCVELLVPTCGHQLGWLSRKRSRTFVIQLMMNCSLKLEVSPTTFYMHFCHHHLSHHRTTVLDSVLTHFSYLNAQHIFLTVIF